MALPCSRFSLPSTRAPVSFERAPSPIPLRVAEQAFALRFVYATAARGQTFVSIFNYRDVTVLVTTAELVFMPEQEKAVPVQQTTELSFLQTSNFVDQIYLYAGLAVDNKHETGFIAKEIRKHNYQTVSFVA